MKYLPYEYQKVAENKILSLPGTGLFLGMGLGKTVITLTAINRLMYEEFEVQRVLVIAPKRVAEDTWGTESLKWDHLNHLRLSRVLGTEKQRLAALSTDADVYVINRENVKWLVDEYRKNWPFDMIVIDELSSFKSSQAKRFRALKSVRPRVRRIVGLTGTPRPKSLLDLWAQVYLLDGGERLGKTFTGFRSRYFRPGRRNGYTVFGWEPLEGAEEAVYDKISDICFSMSAEDYLQLPERIDNFVWVKMSEPERKKYLKLEKDRVLELGRSEILALTACAVAGKLLQMANGAVYDSDGVYQEIHSRKLDALEDILEFTEDTVLVFYNYRHDKERIMQRFQHLIPRNLESEKDIRDWNEGKVRLLLAHPASAGYGLNIQAGGHIIVWYGLPWNLELYQQANARLHRQGQKERVFIHHLLADGTYDELVVKSLEQKDMEQKYLLEAVKARMEELRQI